MKSILKYILFFAIVGCSKTIQEDKVFFSNLEKVSESEKKILGEGNFVYKLSGYNALSKEKAFSANTSIKLNKENQFGLSFSIDSVEQGQYLSISVYRYSKNRNLGFIVASSEDSKEFYIKGNNISQEFDNGWDKIFLNIDIPEYMHNKRLKVYLWNSDEQPVYFDDLSVRLRKSFEYPVYEELDYLDMYVENEEYQKIVNKRTKAIEIGVLQSIENDYVIAKLNYKTYNVNAKIRLKGDWVDHLKGKKWSYRVKPSTQIFKDVKIFSIQTPKSRDFLSEWIAHKLFAREGVLTSEYDFVPVRLNDENLGLYAMEQHFDSILLEKHHKTVAPIIKFDDELYWEGQKIKKIEGHVQHLPYLLAADILPFSAGGSLKSDKFKLDFVKAQNLLDKYRYGKLKASEVFDVNLLAKTYALYDLTKSYHALAWHNLRYYYNPQTSLLEPIPYDCYTDNGVYNYFEEPIIGLAALKDVNDYQNYFAFQCFNDSAFVNLYIQYLREYSSKDFVEEFLSEIGKYIVYYEKLIQQEFDCYKYNQKFLEENAENIRVTLSEFKLEKTDIVRPDFISREDTIEGRFLQYLVKVYTQSINNAKTKKIKIVNLSPNDIYFPEYEIECLGDKQKATYKYLDIDFSKKDIKFTTPSSKKVYTVKIFDWSLN